jgi:hypothetical protein
VAFYRNDLLSTTVITVVAFGAPVLVQKLAEHRAQKIAV